jgi:hypothetical protein
MQRSEVFEGIVSTQGNDLGINKISLKRYDLKFRTRVAECTLLPVISKMTHMHSLMIVSRAFMHVAHKL